MRHLSAVHPLMMAHLPSSFYPSGLLKDLEFLLHAAVERTTARALQDATTDPFLHAFPRVVAMQAQPHDLITFWTHALEQGMVPATPMGRDVLAAYAHEFLQEVVDALMAHHGTFDPVDAERAAEVTNGLLRTTFHAAFDRVYAVDLIGDDVADDADMPAIDATLTRGQQRRVVLGAMQVCVHHAQRHGTVC